MSIKGITRMFKGESLTQLKPILGRWNTNNLRESMIKNKHATEDNCFMSCNNYQDTIKIHCNTQEDHKYIFMMGYESSA